MNSCNHIKRNVSEWQGHRVVQCADCGAILEQPSVDEVLTAFQNQENGLPPGLQELLAGAKDDDDRKLIMLGLIECLSQGSQPTPARKGRKRK
jgi:Zn-finger protein